MRRVGPKMWCGSEAGQDKVWKREVGSMKINGRGEGGEYIRWGIGRKCEGGWGASAVWVGGRKRRGNVVRVIILSYNYKSIPFPFYRNKLKLDSWSKYEILSECDFLYRIITLKILTYYVFVKKSPNFSFMQNWILIFQFSTN